MQVPTNPVPPNFSTSSPIGSDKSSSTSSSSKSTGTSVGGKQKNALNDIGKEMLGEIEIIAETKHRAINPESIQILPSEHAFSPNQKERFHDIKNKPDSPIPDTTHLKHGEKTGKTLLATDSPPKTTINEGPNGGYGTHTAAIKKLIADDATNVKDAVKLFETGTIKLTANNKELTSACKELIENNDKLFTDPKAFKALWDEFKKDPKTFPVDTPDAAFDLEGKGYHNIGHAKEMFYDTYEKLSNKGLPESTCMAGATMAFFHDLVQGVEGKFPVPPLGKNEDVTAKFLHFIIDKKGTNSPSDKALKVLADATIVGGTFLMRALDEKGEKKNVSLSEHVDSPMDEGAEKNILKGIRHILAENDVSRTLDGPTTESVIPQTGIMKTITDSKRKAEENFPALVKNNTIANKLFQENGKNLVSRMFQSIRFLHELPVQKQKSENGVLLVKADGTPDLVPTPLPNKNLILGYLKGEGGLDEDGQALVKLFVDKLKRDTTWTKAFPFGDFSEVNFAKQSNHTAYAEMLMKNVGLMTTASDEEIKGLILIALGQGQDGASLPNVSELFGSTGSSQQE